MIRLRPVGLAAAACLVLTFLVFAGPGAGHGKPKPTKAAKAILFASDGMRPDLMERYVKKGFMPTYRDLLRHGVRGRNGLKQGFRRTPE